MTTRANLNHLLVDRHVEAGRGADAAIAEGTATTTFAELAARAARAAGALAAIGVRRGERVVLAQRDGAAWVAAFLGTAGLGAVAVPVDPFAGPERLGEILADCEPTVVVAAGEVEVPAGPWRVVEPAHLAEGPERGPRAVHPGDLAYLVYSSGSTGRPKGAMHAHADLRTGIETYATEVLGLGPGDRCHSAARLFTSLGFGNGFFRPLGLGATLVLTPTRPTVRSVLSAVAEHAVTVLTAVPTFWAQLAEFAERHDVADALVSVRLGVSSGDSLPGPIGERIRRELGIDLLEGLGCSECSNIVISTRAGEGPRGLGRAVAGVDIRLTDPDGRAVEPGEPGRLWIRSASNTSGYWRRPDLTRDLVHGEWIRMGDVLVESGGTYRHVGRADDLFKVDALWVSPSEIEAVLHEHPAVREVAVAGVPDERGLLRAAAWVVAPEAPADLPTTLRRLVASRLDARRAPATVHVVDEIPKLPSGKVNRRALREAAGGVHGS